MRRYNKKQLGLIIGSLVVAFILNWLIWLLLMNHPNEINVVYQALLTLCIGAVFIIIGDRILKTDLYR